MATLKDWVPSYAVQGPLPNTGDMRGIIPTICAHSGSLERRVVRITRLSLLGFKQVMFTW